MKKSEVLTLLQSIQYPGFSRDIVSFGMVKNVDVSQDTVAIELTIKTKNDEKKQAVVDKIENKLSQYFKQVDIQIIDDGPSQGPSAQSPQSPVQQKFNLDHIKNVIAASSIAIHLGIGWDTFREKVKSFKAPKGRCEVKQMNDITIIDDTYNANLNSTLASIDYLKAFSGNGRRVLVFGDMFELGEGSMAHHRQIGEHCLDMELDAVFSTGTETTATDRALNDSVYHQHFDSKNDLLAALQKWITAGDKLLVKGSRGMAMETIIKGLSKN